MAGKFDSTRDEILYSLCVNDWGKRSFGDIPGYGLYVWLIENDAQDVAVNNTEFNSVIEQFIDSSLFEGLRNSLVGNFIVWEDSQGLVTVVEFQNRWFEADQTFNGMKDEYEQFEALEAHADGMDMEEWGREGRGGYSPDPDPDAFYND